MKITRFTLCLLAALMALPVHSQVAISASNVADSFLRPIASARLCFTPVNAVAQPLGFRVGSQQIVPNEVCGTITSGVLQPGKTLAPTATGIQYHVYLKAPAANTIIRDYGYTPITGSSWTLDSYDPGNAALPAGSLSVGTVTPLAPGSTPAASVTGGNGVYQLNVAIPVGQPGIGSDANCHADGSGKLVCATVTAGAVFNSTGRGIDLIAAGAKCDSDGTSGNGTDDRAAIQAVLSSLTSKGSTIIVPPGHVCRLSDYVAATVSNLEITGGGVLFFDPPAVSGHPTFGKAIAAIYAAGLQIYTPGCDFHTATNPQDVTTGRTPATAVISNISLHDFSITSVGAYGGLIWNGQAEPGTNIPLNHGGVSVFCANNVDISHMKMSGFYTDAVEVWGVVGLHVGTNSISGVGLNGIGAYMVSDAAYQNNVIKGAGEGLEVNMLRGIISGNVVSVVAMDGISVSGGPSAGLNLSGLVASNPVIRDSTLTAAAYNGIKVWCSSASASCIDAVSITDNTIVGAWSNGIYSTTGQAVSVRGNVGVFTAASGGGYGIQMDAPTGWPMNPPFSLSENTLTFTTSQYTDGILATGTGTGHVQYILQNNSLVAPAFAGGNPSGYYLTTTGIGCQMLNQSTTAAQPGSGCGMSIDSLNVAGVVNVTGNVGLGTSSAKVGIGVAGASAIVPLDVYGSASSAPASTTSTPNGSTWIGTTATGAGLSMGVNGGNGSWLQSRSRTSANYYPLVLNPNGGAVMAGTSYIPLQSTGAQVAAQVACVKSIGPPTVIGTCSGTVNATTGACGTCN